MTQAFVGLGSNLGDSESEIRQAFGALDAVAQTRLVRQSRLYRTPPWGRADQPDYVNAVAELETRLEPIALLRAMLSIERDAGRVRDGSRWGPRTLDLDLLLYADRLIHVDGLQVPHPHLAERAFVLLPLVELAPEYDVPGMGRVAALLQGVDASNCRPLSSQQNDAGA